MKEVGGSQHEEIRFYSFYDSSARSSRGDGKAVHAHHTKLHKQEE